MKLLLLFMFSMLMLTMSPLEAKESMSLEQRVEAGKAIAFNRRKGNCLACHMMGDGQLPGNVGPPMVAMKARFPDRDTLVAQIWDATIKNPYSVMPPFGSHGILSKKEIQLVVDYLYSL